MSAAVPMTSPVTTSSPLGAAPSTARRWRDARPQTLAQRLSAARALAAQPTGIQALRSEVKRGA